MKFFYIIFLFTSIAFSQTVETLDYVWVFLDNPNTSAVVGIQGSINNQSFNRQIAELDSISDSTWGVQFLSTQYGPFKFHEMITVSVKFLYSDTNFVGISADTCAVLLAGDFNNDNRVNGKDLEEFKKVFGRTGVGYRTFEDMNRDGRVDGRDLQEWKKYNGRVWVPSCN